MFLFENIIGFYEAADFGCIGSASCGDIYRTELNLSAVGLFSGDAGGGAAEGKFVAAGINFNASYLGNGCVEGVLYGLVSIRAPTEDFADNDVICVGTQKAAGRAIFGAGSINRPGPGCRRVISQQDCTCQQAESEYGQDSFHFVPL